MSHDSHVPRSLRMLVVVAVLILFTCTVLGQTTSARPDRGTMPNGSYSVSDFENISLQNGNVNLTIPLASLPPIAGGRLSWTLSAQYNSKIWDVVRTQAIGQDFNLSQHYYEIDAVQPSPYGGWRITGQYTLEFRPAEYDFDYELPPVADQDYPLMVNNTWYKMVLVMPDGAEHELRALDYAPFPGGKEFLRGYYKDTPYTHGAMRYYSFDGSYLYATISGPTNWTVYLPDGTRIIQTTDNVQRIQDTNGNSIKIFSDAQGTHYQDELTGREIRYFFDPAANNNKGQGQVWYQTVNGVWMRIDVNFGATLVQGKLYTVNDWVHGQLSEQPCQRQALLSRTLQVVDEIVFPQTEPNQANRRFSFTYNSATTETATNNARFSCSASLQPYTRQASKGWGSLSKIVTPSGAEIEYAYSLDSGGNSFAHLPLATDEIAGETITKKTIVQDGPDDVWTFQIWDTGAVQTYLADNSTIQELKYPQGTAMGTGFGGTSFGRSGLSYRTIKPFMTVERHWTTLAFDGANNNSPGGTINFNCVVDAEYTTLTDASGNALKMSAKTFTYDYNGNVLQTTEYDWFDPALVTRDSTGVPVGVPAGATVLRVANNSYYNPANSSSSASVYAKRSGGVPSILNAIKEASLGPGIARFSYDGQPFGTAPSIGNLTSKSVWDDLDNKWITTSNSYDVYGNVITSTDALGKVTQYFYDDATHAQPTRIVVDPQNGSGTQTTTTVYDFATGLILIATDPNGQQSTIDYVNQLTGLPDPFGRPGMTKSPAVNTGGTRQRVTTTYLDSARQVIVAADLNAETDQLLKTRTTADKLGRATLTEQTEDGVNYTISVRQAYLDMGRVTLTSSSLRSAASSTDSWTRVTQDDAGRLIEVATFGGAAQPAWSGTGGVFTGSVTTAYNANFTTLTDQAGKVRRSMMDALGRLIREDEPDASNNLGSTSSPAQPTNYAYDVLGNLLTVTQGSQTRSFTYDSLTRLRTAVNPESGTISYLYDDNGNLVVRTDSRGVSMHNSYDSINRLTRRWYNDSNAVSDTTHDAVLPGGVEPTAEVKFYYDALPSIGGPTYSPGATVGRLVAQTYGSGSDGDYFGYDNLGRLNQKFQKVGANNYGITATYSLSGALIGTGYPSGHTVANSYDQAGRLSSFSGSLGDGTTRTYSTGILYGPTGVMVKEQFGTNTAIYNKQFYNSRGQLAEVRASTSYTGPTDTDANRGGIVNYYSDTGADNNGNLRRQEILVPGQTTRVQEFEYDSLNRLTSALEKISNNTQWSQTFGYDRWGNRTILAATGVDLSNKQFTINTANNRYGVPAGQSGVMQFDAAGNLTNDTYTGTGVRKYDAENKMTYAMGQTAQAQTYAYDGSGQRVKRVVNGVETWQIYGFGGELLAEYAVNGAAASPQKEYGYRNGQLLVTAEPAATNVALSSNGATATASSAYDPSVCGSGAASANDGDRTGRARCSNRVWNDAAPANTFPDWLQVDFNGSKTITEIDVVTIQDHLEWPVEPTDALTFSQYGLTGYEVQYWNGSAWVTVPGGSVSGNNKVWRKFTFAAITTSRIRVLASASVDGYSRIVELEAWTGPSPPPRYDIALGATATASTSYAGWGPTAVVNGDRKSLNAYSNGAWSSSAANNFPEWVEVNFGASKTINQIDLFTLQDNWGGSAEPTSAMTFTLYGLSGYEVQYWSGSNWVTVPGCSVTGNNKIWRTFAFSPITTSKIRVVSSAAPDGVSRITEIEAYGPAEPGGSGNGVQWLVSDHLGTPRIIFDQSGDLAKVKRHDYAPFGEELTTVGGRVSDPAYSGGDKIRQQFSKKLRDFETGLDYFGARFYASPHGRFLSVDPLMASGLAVEPQSWNRYAFVSNNPLRYVDDDGLVKRDKSGNVIFTAEDPSGRIRHPSGLSGPVEIGHVFGDDGTPITAFRNREDGDYRLDTNCHGLTFVDGKYWIDNTEIPTLLQADGYKKVDSLGIKPQVGDVVVYTVDGKVKHSATVTAVDEQGNVTAVSGIAGVSTFAGTTAPDQGWTEPNTKITYYRKARDGRTEEQRRENLQRTQSFNKNMRRLGKAIEKEVGKPPKPPKLRKASKN